MSISTASIITLVRSLIDDNLRTDGFNAFEYDADSSFQLNKDYVASTGIKVYQNGTELPSTEWGYNSDTNKVTISFDLSGYALTKGDNILITFNYYDRYSDQEITDFIRASLMEFTKRRYKKTFYMNSSNQVVAYNDINLTEKESHIVALVTAIKIDPRNVKLDTRDFKITAEENKTATEQIDEVIGMFTRSFGRVSFIQEEWED